MSSSLCQCGHPKATHYAWNTSGSSHGPCRATVYTEIGRGPAAGMTATGCKCPRFSEKKS